MDFVCMRNFRTAFRIPCLHGRKQVSDAFWAELCSLETHYTTQSQKPEYSIWASGCARVFTIEHRITELDVADVLRIIYAVSHPVLVAHCCSKKKKKKKKIT
jgi:hypothetical protein